MPATKTIQWRPSRVRTLELLALVALLHCVPAVRPAHGAAASTLSIDGFTVESGQLSDDQRRVAILSVRTQISIVNSVGLPASVLAFMQTVPILVEATAISGGAQYRLSDGRWIVALPPETIPSTRPVLLHELIHAYHHQLLGVNDEILEGYQAAINASGLGGRYRKTHFLKDQREFFAIASTIFLFRKIEQPPYDCSALRRELPDFLAFLATLFGPHECN
jgi:hypothetical protein